MKQFLLALLFALISFLSPGQAPTFGPPLVGLPDDLFASANNAVFTTRTMRQIEIVPTSTKIVRGGVTTYRQSHTIRWNTKIRTVQSVGVYGLNLVHDYVHEYGCAPKGSNDTATILQRTNQECYLVKAGNAVRFHIITHPEEYTSLRSGKFEKHSRAYVDSLCRAVLKISIDEMESRARMTLSGTYRDPNTSITSLFAYATIEGGKVVNRTFISGRQWDSYNASNKLTANGRTGFGYMFQWRYLNGCTPDQTDVASLMEGFGNFGQCGKTAWLERTDPLSASVSYTFGPAFSNGSIVTFDQSKSPWVVLYLGEKPITGKEASTQCWLNLLTGECSTFAPRG